MMREMILLAHGSPDMSHAEALQQLADQCSGRLGQRVHLQFLGDEIATGALVLPLFLGEGGHVAEARAAIEQAGAFALPLISEHAESLVHAWRNNFSHDVTDTTLVVWTLYQQRGFEAMMAAITSVQHLGDQKIAALHGERLLGDLLTEQWHLGVRSCWVQPVLLADGRSLKQLHAIVAAFQSQHPEMVIKVGMPLLHQIGFADLIADIFNQRRNAAKESGVCHGG
ncbi:MAG: hypothetical protein HQM07_07385 [Zetaproteobacteria bacterium]|nr:hypothetical protein [Zetaproteobacteria bacterium]